jgi:adenylate cyclase
MAQDAEQSAPPLRPRSLTRRISAIADWLTAGAPSTPELDQAIKKVCDDLCASGLPLWRAAVFVRTLHPDFFGRAFVWRRGAGVTVQRGEHSFRRTEDYLNSPIHLLYKDGKPVRQRLTEPPVAGELPFFGEQRAEGVTDYLAVPLRFMDGSLHGASWSTKRRGGFTDTHLAALNSLTGPLARLVENHELRHIAANLLDTYVGNNAGARILAGQIQRGHADKIRAAIWLSDMRGFTALSDRLPPETTVAVLNRYFDCQVPVIREHGGEILKFMGDGLLAIFPIAPNDSDIDAVCLRALAAARAMRRNVETLNATDARALGQPLRFGLALHVGEVLYGNIGGTGRLDFTCIGPAVNLVARLEKLAAQLGRSVIASASFARQCRSDMEELGAFSVAGFAAAQTAYGLREEGRVEDASV